MNRRSLLAMVHIGCKDLGLDETVYRGLLERVTGERTAAKASDNALSRVIQEFRRLGWKPKPVPPRRAKNRQARMIWGLWSELCKLGAVREPTRTSLRSFCKRLTGVEDPDWLDQQQSWRVIESLKTWRARTVKETSR